jgi:photosystem II stability/assembly factor-like uncharacterized protein
MKKALLLICVLSFAGLLFAQGDWQVIQGPTEPLIYSLTNVFFLNPNEGWIVGGVGTLQPVAILHTGDAGQTWDVLFTLPPGADTTFNDAYFLDSNTGWLVGDNGVIWKTDNGGTSWTDQSPDTSITTSHLQSVSPVDGNTIYVSGDDGAILKSIDGGTTWMDQTIAGSGSDLDRIHAFNADTAFAMSNTNDGYIYSTIDGGAKWDTLNAPFPGPGISLRQYDCVGLPNGTAYISGYHGTVFKSTDYGRSWTNVANIFGALYKIFYSIGASGDHIWCGDSNGRLYYSPDAGASWDTLAFSTTNNVEYIKAFDNNHVYFYCRYGQLFETNDAGQTYTPLIPWPNLSWWDMVTTSNKIFIGSISGGEISVSEDDGQSWSHPVTPVPGQVGAIDDIFFLDDNTGFFCGQDGMIGKTTDAGLTWALKPTSYGFASNKTYYFIYFKDALNGFAGGSSSIIQTSDDGGETWTEGALPVSATAYDCYFLNPDTGFIAASSGKIFRTNDGGASWSELIDFGSQTMRNIFFLDNSTGFLCASSGYLFKTIDGGDIWAEDTVLANMNAPGDVPDLYRIQFVNATTGYICGEDGALYKSSDAGMTWIQQDVPPEAVGVTLQAMAWTDETTGYLGGQNGYIFSNASPPPPPSPLVLNEVMWDVTRDDAGTPNVNEGDANGDGTRSPRGDEFIELVNTGDTQLDISGYQILRRNGYLVFTFPASVVLDPGEYTVVFGGVGPDGFGPEFPPTLKIFASKPGEADSGFADLTSTNMLSAGDNVVIVNPAASDTIAEIYWGTATPVSSVAMKTEPPNTVDDQIISGAVAQSVTRNPDLTGLWDLHTHAAPGIYHSPGAPSDNPYVGIADKKGKNVPESYMLYQNYPNPFNPETTVSFDLPASGKVTLTIYNTLGQVVKTLYNGNFNAGSHTVKWDGRNDYGFSSPSGIYFCKMKAGDYNNVKKMILMR